MGTACLELCAYSLGGVHLGRAVIEGPAVRD